MITPPKLMHATRTMSTINDVQIDPTATASDNISLISQKSVFDASSTYHPVADKATADKADGSADVLCPAVLTGVYLCCQLFIILI